jgi:Kdo2-lipid IVA lauroyltransferase/acyltransferase
MISAEKLGEYARRALYLTVYGVFAILPMEKASALGSWIARNLGPRLRVHQLARRNIERALPDESPRDVDDILGEMWDNLGRVCGEFPHIGRLDLYSDPRIEVVGTEHVDYLRDDGKPGIFFTPHIGNWELSAYAVMQRGFFKNIAVVYRAPNDPAAEWLLRIGRKNLEAELIPKGSAGARRIIEVLRAGGHVGMLPDQKMNDGISVPFFGRPAMTAPALAQLALKFGCTILPGRVVRLDGARFRLIIDPPIPLPDSGDRHADVIALTTTLNQVMEAYIREHPGQWLWVHKRWPD